MQYLNSELFSEKHIFQNNEQATAYLHKVFYVLCHQNEIEYCRMHDFTRTKVRERHDIIDLDLLLEYTVNSTYCVLSIDIRQKLKKN